MPAISTRSSTPGRGRSSRSSGAGILVSHGHKGELDIGHIREFPSAARQAGDHVADRRIGSFYDERGKAYRVNGRIAANRIEFYIDLKNPNARYDQIGGRRFAYTLEEMVAKLGKCAGFRRCNPQSGSIVRPWWQASVC